MHFVEKSSLVCFKSRISAETAISENNMSKVCRRILTEWENLHNFLLVQEPSGERFSVEKSDQSLGELLSVGVASVIPFWVTQFAGHSGHIILH